MEPMPSDLRDLARMIDGLCRVRDLIRHPAITSIADWVDLGTTGLALDEATTPPLWSIRTAVFAASTTFTSSTAL